jgi:dihydroorotase
VHRGEEIGKARVLPLGALTLGLKGERLAELAGLHKAGCVAFSQANKPVVDTEALLRAMEYAATFGFAVWLQPQDYWLSRNGIAHEGELASRLGWPAFRLLPRPSRSPPSSSWSAIPAAACT